MIPLPLAGDGAARERRLRELLAADPSLRARVDERVLTAFLEGSLALAGLGASYVDAERVVVAKVAADAPLAAEALRPWVDALGGWRTAPLAGAAPPELVASRLQLLYEWVGSESGLELPPAAAAALVMARLMEIRPLAEGNGRLARIAARHVMRRAGSVAFVLGEEDREELREAIAAAQAFDTRPLVDLLAKGVARAVDVAAGAL